MDRTGSGASDTFLPTIVRLQSDGCERISEITLDAISIRAKQSSDDVGDSAAIQSLILAAAVAADTGSAVSVAVQMDDTTVAQSADSSIIPHKNSTDLNGPTDWFTGKDLNLAASGLANDQKVFFTNPPGGLLAQQNNNVGTRNPPYWYVKNLQADTGLSITGHADHNSKFQLSWDNSTIWAGENGSFGDRANNESVRPLVDHFQATAHGFDNDAKVTITNAPSQLTNDFYYVVNKTADDFQVSASSSGGTAIADLGAVSASCTVALAGISETAAAVATSASTTLSALALTSHNTLHSDIPLQNVVIRLTGENLAFNFLSNVVARGDVIDGAIFAVVQTRSEISGSAFVPRLHLWQRFDTADKPYCHVVPPGPLKQLKIEVTKADQLDEMVIGSQNASMDLEFSLYSEASAE